MNWRERLCSFYLDLGKIPVAARDRQNADHHASLAPLKRAFPDLLDNVAGKRVIDFGCGIGNQSFALKAAGAREVLGVEILDDRVGRANARLAQDPVGGLSFVKKLGPGHRGYDVAISLNSFEHFADPPGVLGEIYGALRDGGRLFMSFGPLWWSAYGPHQMEYTKSPWPHVLFSEKTYMGARRKHCFPNSNAVTYADRWLNQMTVSRYERIIADSPFSLADERYFCTRGLGILKRIPGARELAVNIIRCELIRGENPEEGMPG